MPETNTTTDLYREALINLLDRFYRPRYVELYDLEDARALRDALDLLETDPPEDG